MTTKKKIESNRRNGRKSKGPVSPEGKRNSRRNALKHGIMATTLLQEDEFFDDDRKAAEAELARLFEELQPKDILEEFEIENVADLRTRLRLVDRAMAGQVRTRQEQVRQQYVENDGGNTSEGYLEKQKAILREAVLEGLCVPMLDAGQLLLRYDTTYRRQLSRATKALQETQEKKRSRVSPADGGCCRTNQVDSGSLSSRRSRLLLTKRVTGRREKKSSAKRADSRSI